MNALLRHGDCLDPVFGLGSLSSVDHVITDPPYSAHVDRNSLRGRGHRPGGVRKALGFRPIDAEVMAALAVQFERVVRRWVVVFCAVEQVSPWKEALARAGLDYVRCGAWVKRYATPQFSGDRPGTGFEAMVIAHRKGRKRWNGGGRLGIWECATAYREGDKIVHTTQKPLVLMRGLVEDFTDPGDVVCDPFTGSGTTGVAAVELGRGFVGWEMDAEHHSTALRRIGAACEQPGLPSTRAGQRKPTAVT